MMQITLLDGHALEIQREEAMELLPYEHVLLCTQLRPPIEGVFPHRGKLLPVLGPMPSPDQLAAASAEQRPFLLVMKGYVQVVRGLPTFREDRTSQSGPEAVVSGGRSEEESLLDELDEILKAA